MVCSLNTLFVLIVMALVVAVAVANLPPAVAILEKYTWFSPLLFIGVSLTWAVVAPALPPIARLAIFYLWCASFILVAGWMATQTLYRGALFFALGFAIFALFLVIAFAHSNPHIDIAEQSSLATALTLAAFASSLFLPRYLPFFSDDFAIPRHAVLYFTCTAVAVAVILYEIWSVRGYTARNSANLLDIHHTCMYATMSPWTEAVDTFGLLTSNNKCPCKSQGHRNFEF